MTLEHLLFLPLKSILEFVYKPEFKQESTAVKTIKFIICAAAGIPICSSTATNGLFNMFAEFHGSSVTTTAIDPIKNTRIRQITLFVAVLLLLQVLQIHQPLLLQSLIP